MGVKTEKRRLTNVLGEDSGKIEFIDNLFDNFAENKLPEPSKKVIKNVLAQKFKEDRMIGCSNADRFMRHNLHLFNKNVTDDEKYINCVLEFKDNKERIDMANLLKEIRNSDNNKRKK